mgnify:CR=1 FL=1
MIEFIVSAIGFYYFFAHSLTTSRPFIQFALFKDKNFLGGCVFMTVMGLVLYSTMALSSPYLQNVVGYPIITAGLLLASRGFGKLYHPADRFAEFMAKEDAAMGDIFRSLQKA